MRGLRLQHVAGHQLDARPVLEHQSQLWSGQEEVDGGDVPDTLRLDLWTGRHAKPEVQRHISQRRLARIEDERIGLAGRHLAELERQLLRDAVADGRPSARRVDIGEQGETIREATPRTGKSDGNQRPAKNGDECESGRSNHGLPR